MKIYQLLEAIVKTEVQPDKKFHGTLRPRDFGNRIRQSEFSVVTHKENDPHMVRKHNYRPMDPKASRRFRTDGFNFFVQELINRDAMDNIYFPKVYSMKKISDDSNQYIHTYKTEKLYDMKQLSREELLKICEEIFGPDDMSNDFDENDLISIIAGKIEYALINYDYSDIKSDELINALQILAGIAKDAIKSPEKYRLDVHTQNIMARRTPYGPQLVINDPLA